MTRLSRTKPTVSAYTEVKLKETPRLLRIPHSECPDVWICLSWQKMAKLMDKHWRSRGTSGKKFIWSSISWIGMGKRIRRSSFFELGWEKVPNWECMFVHRFFCQCMWMTSNGWKETEYVSQVEEMDDKRWSWGTNMMSSWSCTLGMYSNVNANRMQHLLNNIRDVCITFFCWSNWKIAGVGKASRKDRSVVPRHGGTCSKKIVERWCELANKKWSSFKMFQVIAWMIFK